MSVRAAANPIPDASVLSAWTLLVVSADSLQGVVLVCAVCETEKGSTFCPFNEPVQGAGRMFLVTPNEITRSMLIFFLPESSLFGRFNHPIFFCDHK